MSGKTARIGLMQVECNRSWSVEECQEHMLFLAEKCCRDGADLAFTPEFFQYDAVWHSAKPIELVRKYSGAFKQRCSELAKKYGTYIVPWDFEEEQGCVYNTCYVLDRQGNELGRYKKVHPAFGELDGGISKGDKFKVFDLDFGKVGIMICFDNYYPESARILSLMGAELILYPLIGDTLKGQWEIKLKARAIDNSVFVAPCHVCSSPREELVTYTGMISPTGEVLCRLTEEGSWKVIDIEMGKKVLTNTSAKEGRSEDIKQLLLKLRNPGAYAALLEEVATPEWSEIKFTK